MKVLVFFAAVLAFASAQTPIGHLVTIAKGFTVNTPDSGADISDTANITLNWLLNDVFDPSVYFVSCILNDLGPNLRVTMSDTFGK